MVDKISKKQRSWNMSRVRSADTKPELFVRKLLHHMGFRFRLNGSVSKKYSTKGVLVGRPDIVLPLIKQLYSYMVAFGIGTQTALVQPYRKLELTGGLKN